jgi:hypothetical protein
VGNDTRIHQLFVDLVQAAPVDRTHRT